MTGPAGSPSGVRQVALSAGRDLDRTLAFWHDCLGLALHSRFDPPGIAFIIVGGVRLFFSDGLPAGTVYLDIDGLDAFVAEAVRNGAAFTERGRGEALLLKPYASEFATFQTERERLEQFRSTLPAVRRALANTATYMICDDHEITDDWYFNLAWCERVLQKPLGRAIIRNGLSAYAVFQAWGNTPEQFAECRNDPPACYLAAWYDQQLAEQGR